MRVAGELHVVRGARLVESARMKHFRRSRRGGQEVLYVLVEPVGGRADETCGNVLRAMARELETNQGSLTSVLLRGLQAAHQRLHEENRRALLEHQIGAKVTAALLHGDDVYLALAGGASAVVVRGNAVETPGLTGARPIGFEAEPAIDLRHVAGTPGGSLLLTSSPVMPGVEPEDLADILALDDRAALDQLRSLADPNATFSAVLLRQNPPLTEPTPSSAVVGAPSRQGAGGPAGEPQGAALRTARPLATLASLLRMGEGRPAANKRKAGRARPPDDGGHAPVGGGRRAAGSRRLDSGGGRRWPALSVESLRVALLLAVVFAVMAVVATLAWIVPRQAQVQIEANAARTVEQAEQTRLKALLATDRDGQRRLLKDAEQIARSVLGVSAVEAKATALLETVAVDLARLDAVHSLTDLQPLAPSTAFAGGVKDVRGIAIAVDALFVLADGRIHRFRLTPDGRALAQPTSTAIGVPGDAAKLAWIGWASAGSARQQDGLVAVDEQRNLWEWSGGEELRRLALRGADTWDSFRAARSYGGNLYILDGAGSQVLRYLPTQAGYDSESRGILEAASIADAVDLAVDGNVFVLTGGGKVWKFVGGRGQLLSMAGIDRPLKEPGMILATPATKHLYVADTGNQRVVVLDKEGRFLRQLVADIPIRSVHVDELAGRLYVAGPTGISVAALPQ